MSCSALTSVRRARIVVRRAGPCGAGQEDGGEQRHGEAQRRAMAAARHGVNLKGTRAEPSAGTVIVASFDSPVGT